MKIWDDGRKTGLLLAAWIATACGVVIVAVIEVMNR